MKFYLLSEDKAINLEKVFYVYIYCENYAWYLRFHSEQDYTDSKPFRTKELAQTALPKILNLEILTQKDYQGHL